MAALNGPASDDVPFALYGGETLVAADPMVNLLDVFDGAVQGRVYVTNFRLVFVPAADDRKGGAHLSLPLGLIERVDKMGGQSSRGQHAYGIELTCKDMRNLRLAHRQENHSRRQVYEAILNHAFPLSSSSQPFAFSYRGRPGSFQLAEPAEVPTPGWQLYDPHKEAARMGLNQSWKLVDYNKDFRLCPTYPEVFIVPATSTPQTIEQVASFRSKGRLPVLSWFHRRTQASLTRCSQPRVGVVGKRSSADETYIQTIRNLNPTDSSCLYIKDARPRRNAMANQAKGLGYESASNYPGCELSFLNIHNIHVMRDSLRKIRALCWPQPEETHWFVNLEQTGWLKHVKAILVGAVQIVELLEKGASVLIHCSDGWDRTAQLSALSMLLLDPYYRTIEGFAVLVEKEWVGFGHKFAQRLGTCDKKDSDDQRSPVFLQFIDCVWQIMQQYPCAFEFNEAFLIAILDEMHSAMFGTFLYNNERERAIHKVRQATISLWDHVLACREDFSNHLYSPAMQADVLRISPSMRNLQLWKNYYVRWSPEYLPKESVVDRLKELQQARERLEAECRELQRQVQENSSV